MPGSNQEPLLELQKSLWKARAQAKQKWLEQTLAESANGPRSTVRRATWINRTLDAVRRSKADVTYRAALMDAYAEHLSVLEMILLAATEQNATPAAETTGATKTKKQ